MRRIDGDVVVARAGPEGQPAREVAGGPICDAGPRKSQHEDLSVRGHVLVAGRRRQGVPGDEGVGVTGARAFVDHHQRVAPATDVDVQRTGDIHDGARQVVRVQAVDDGIWTRLVVSYTASA